MTLPPRSITAPRGFRAAGGSCGIKASGKPDLALIAADEDCATAAIFTTNRIPGESVILGRKHAAGPCRAILCNSGVANASTGPQGIRDALAMCRGAAKHLDCRPQQILACSTGVIGKRLPMKKILPGIDELAQRLERTGRADADAATAILTTDTRPKGALVRVRWGAGAFLIGGIAKGSGMIAPNMATMLAFITTDADISQPLLRRALHEAVNADASFNRISVDSDTSPSDTVAVLASAKAIHRPIRSAGAGWKIFTQGLTDLCRQLAYAIISDGEGATRVIRVEVQGARTDEDARLVGRAVAESPLVKTAVHGADPNWGRVVAAAGKCGATVDPNKLSLRIGPIEVYRAGVPTSARASALRPLMRGKEVLFTLRLNLGHARTQWLGCDLSPKYVEINAEYHT